MKYTHNWLLLLLVIFFLFSSCNTTKRTANENTSSKEKLIENELNAKRQISKKTSFSQTKHEAEKSQKQLLMDSILPFDSTVFYFTRQNIANLKNQLSSETIQNIGIIEGSYYFKSILQNELRQQVGEEKAKDYLLILESNSRITTEEKIIREKTDYILHALETGQTVPRKLGGTHIIEPYNNISSTIQSIYKNYPLFNIILPYEGYTSERKYLGSIYNGEVCRAVSLFNIAYNETKTQHPLNMEARLKIILEMEFGSESNINITNISEIQNKDEIVRLLTHNLTISINNIQRQFTLGFDHDIFYSLREITKTKEEKLFTIRFISK